MLHRRVKAGGDVETTRIMTVSASAKEKRANELGWNGSEHAPLEVQESVHVSAHHASVSAHPG